MSGDLAFAGVTGQREALRAGAVSSAELLESALARIETYDAALGSFRTVPASPGRLRVALSWATPVPQPLPAELTGAVVATGGDPARTRPPRGRKPIRPTAKS
jgi:Asp-tRNA(Asn)/Glu-tRNA(Gln) amidotransferase A subunit family amidase